jgi:hypothetical protein
MKVYYCVHNSPPLAPILSLMTSSSSSHPILWRSISMLSSCLRLDFLSRHLPYVLISSRAISRVNVELKTNVSDIFSNSSDGGISETLVFNLTLTRLISRDFSIFIRSESFKYCLPYGFSIKTYMHFSLLPWVLHVKSFPPTTIWSTTIWGRL